MPGQESVHGCLQPFTIGRRALPGEQPVAIRRWMVELCRPSRLLIAPASAMTVGWVRQQHPAFAADVTAVKQRGYGPPLRVYKIRKSISATSRPHVSEYGLFPVFRPSADSPMPYTFMVLSPGSVGCDLLDSLWSVQVWFGTPAFDPVRIKELPVGCFGGDRQRSSRINTPYPALNKYGLSFLNPV